MIWGCVACYALTLYFSPLQKEDISSDQIIGIMMITWGLIVFLWGIASTMPSPFYWLDRRWTLFDGMLLMFGGFLIILGGVSQFLIKFNLLKPHNSLPILTILTAMIAILIGGVINLINFENVSVRDWIFNKSILLGFSSLFLIYTIRKSKRLNIKFKLLF